MEFATASKWSWRTEKSPRFASDRAAEAIDLGGNYLAPGFIDLHIHGALGRDTMEASPEAFQRHLRLSRQRRHDFAAADDGDRADPEIVDVLRAVRDMPRRSQANRRRARRRAVHLAKARRARNARSSSAIRSRSSCDQLLEFADVIKTRHARARVAGCAGADRSAARRRTSPSAAATATPRMRRRASAFEHGMRHVTHTFNCMSSSAPQRGSIAWRVCSNSRSANRRSCAS